MDSTPKFAGKSEYIIKNVAGCGYFQIVLLLLLNCLSKMPVTFSNVFMSFGYCNPGWRCTDGDKTSNNSSTYQRHNFEGNCSKEFDTCENIEFDPNTSTIVSEWGLVCKKTWILTLVLSLQMVGLLMGHFLVGPLIDATGRKVSCFGGIFILTVLNTIAIFSSSWQMFAALRFLIGMSLAAPITVLVLYQAEFVTRKWRGAVVQFPVWALQCILFALACLALKDWRYVHIVTVVLGIVALLPAFWIPESLRWLEVMIKTEKFEAVARRVTIMNGKTLPSMIEVDADLYQEIINESEPTLSRMIHLFRKDYRKHTFLLAVTLFSNNLIFYALNFGVQALSGNLYMNIIILNVSEAIFRLLPLLSSNLIGRKLLGMLLAGVGGLSLLTVALLNRYTTGDLQHIGILVFVNIGITSLGAEWCVIQTCTIELYPTVVRGQAMGFGCAVGIIGPLLIPNDQSTFLFVILQWACWPRYAAVSFHCYQKPKTQLSKKPFNDRKT